MLHIERPSGSDIQDERVELTVRDENALRAATIIVRTVGDTVEIEVQRIENDPRVVVTIP